MEHTFTDQEIQLNLGLVETCMNEKECTVAIKNTVVPEKYVFVNALCKSTEVNFNFLVGDVDMKKTTIALIATICDLAAILLFAFGAGLYFVFKI